MRRRIFRTYLYDAHPGRWFLLGFLLMRQSIPIIAAIAAFVAAPIHADQALEHAKQVLDRSILFDGHNDLPWAIREYKAAPGDVNAYDLRGRAPGTGETDIPRLREGKVGAVSGPFTRHPKQAGGYAKTQLEQIDIARRVIARYPDTFTLASTAADIRAAKKPAASAPCSASKAGTRSRIRWGRCAPITTSACVT